MLNATTLMIIYIALAVIALGFVIFTCTRSIESKRKAIISAEIAAIAVLACLTIARFLG